MLCFLIEFGVVCIFKVLSIVFLQTLETVFQYTILFASSVFCGHIGKEALDGVALAMTVGGL
jgi:hypothetical protein